MTFSIMIPYNDSVTKIYKTLSILTLNKTTLGTMAISIKTHGIMTLNIPTISIKRAA